MTLITRLSRLLQADLHALLDRIEEPDALLKQAVREMEEAVEQDRRKLRVLELEQTLLVDRQAGLHGQLPRLAEELALCFSAGKQDLARGLIRKRLETELSITALAKKHAALESDRSRLQASLGEHTSRLEAVRQRAELVESRGADWGPGSEPESAAVSERDVEIAWLKELQLRERP
jgi:phage shock protein A